jgi:hypothetical protein
VVVVVVVVVDVDSVIELLEVVTVVGGRVDDGSSRCKIKFAVLLSVTGSSTLGMTS